MAVVRPKVDNTIGYGAAASGGQSATTRAKTGSNPWGGVKAAGLAASMSMPWPLNSILSPMFRPSNTTPVNTTASTGPAIPGFVKGRDLDPRYANNPKGWGVVKPEGIFDSAFRTSGGGSDSTDSGDTRMSLSDAMAQIQGLLSGMGVQNGGVSYDPLRDQARSQWSDADARTKAMYDQLQTRIGQESGTVNQVFDQGVANTNDATQFASKQENDSAKSMADMQTQQAQALGIQEAVANNINSGNYEAQDAAARTSDNAARGQITSNLMNTNRTGALTGISNLVGAAGLQGVMDRQTRQNELARLLAQYDVDESKANQESSSNYQSQLSKGVFDLLGLNRDDYAQDSEDAYHARQESNKWDIANLPGSSQTGRAAPLDAETAKQFVIDTYGKDAFGSTLYRGDATKLYLQLMGFQ